MTAEDAERYLADPFTPECLAQACVFVLGCRQSSRESTDGTHTTDQRLFIAGGLMAGGASAGARGP